MQLNTLVNIGIEEQKDGPAPSDCLVWDVADVTVDSMFTSNGVLNNCMFLYIFLNI